MLPFTKSKKKMKTKLLIIIGIIAVVAASLSYYVIYDSSTTVFISCDPRYEQIDDKCVLLKPEQYCTDWCDLQELESLGCNQLVLDYIYRATNLFDEKFDNVYYRNALGLPDGVTQEKFEECADIILEKRLSPDIWDFESLNKMTLFEDPLFSDPDKFTEISEKKDSKCFTTPSMNYFCYAKPRMYDTGSGVSWLVSNTTKISGELHFDNVDVGPSYFTIKNMTLLNGDTAKITFADKNYRVGNSTSTLYEINDDFEFTKIIEKFDTFVAKCDNYEGTSVTVVQYLGVTSIDGVDYFMTWHTNAHSEDGIACDYPQIIQNSFDNDFGNIGHGWGKIENEK